MTKAIAVHEQEMREPLCQIYASPVDAHHVTSIHAHLGAKSEPSSLALILLHTIISGMKKRNNVLSEDTVTH